MGASRRGTLRLAEGLLCGASPSSDSSVVTTLGTLLAHREKSAMEMCCLAEPACGPEPAPAAEVAVAPKIHIKAFELKRTVRTRTACDCCQKRRRSLGASVPSVTCCHAVRNVVRQHIWTVPLQRVVAHTQRLATSRLRTLVCVTGVSHVCVSHQTYRSTLLARKSNARGSAPRRGGSLQRLHILQHLLQEQKDALRGKDRAPSGPSSPAAQCSPLFSRWCIDGASTASCSVIIAGVRHTTWNLVANYLKALRSA